MSTITVASFSRALADLLTEVGDGPANPKGTWVVSNEPGAGVLGTADRVSAAAGSRVPPGCNHSLAGHVGHLVFSLDLFNRASRGEKAYENAKWSESWHADRVSDDEWRDLRNRMRSELQAALEAIGKGPPSLDQVMITGGVGLVAHTAYHLGAIRQLAMLAG